MKNTILFLFTACLLSCSSGGSLSNKEATKTIREYYSKKGCYSKLSHQKLNKISEREEKYIETQYEKLKKGDKHQMISWRVDAINGILVSNDGNSATVDFTLKGKPTAFYKYQEYKTCGFEGDFGPWEMVVELVKYDTGWKVKYEPEGK